LSSLPSIYIYIYLTGFDNWFWILVHHHLPITFVYLKCWIREIIDLYDIMYKINGLNYWYLKLIWMPTKLLLGFTLVLLDQIIHKKKNIIFFVWFEIFYSVSYINFINNFTKFIFTSFSDTYVFLELGKWVCTA